MDALARRLGVQGADGPVRVVEPRAVARARRLRRRDERPRGDRRSARERILLSRAVLRLRRDARGARRQRRTARSSTSRGKRVGTLNQTFAHDILRDACRRSRSMLYEGNEEPYLDLEQRPRSTPCCSTTSSRIATAAPTSTRRCSCLPDDVARGTYVIGMRKGDAELADARSTARSPTMRARRRARAHPAQGAACGTTRQTRAAAGGRRRQRGARARSTPTMLVQFLRAPRVTLEIIAARVPARGAARRCCSRSRASTAAPVRARWRACTSSCSAARRCCCSCSSSTTGSRRT